MRPELGKVLCFYEKIDMLYNNDPRPAPPQARCLNVSASRHPSRWWHFADRLGATAAILCAVHCAALPFVLALLPLLGLEFLAGHVFERVFVICAAVLATVVLLGGFRRHHNRAPLLLALPGLILLLGGIYVDLDTAVMMHTVLVTLGGTLLACAHMLNLRISHAGHIHTGSADPA